MDTSHSAIQLFMMSQLRKADSASRLLTVVVVLFMSVSSWGQVFVESYPPVSNNTDMGVRISGLGTLGDRLSYERISGSPFWKDEWQLASLYGRNEKEHWLCKAKLNFATGELYYLDQNNQELVAVDGFIRRIVFYENGDTGRHIAEFVLAPQTMLLNQEMKNVYLQLLNIGEYQLLKLNKRSLSSADSLFGTLKRYFFTSESIYFIRHGEILNPMKKLDRDNVLSYLPGAKESELWAKQNKTNFRKEGDVLSFLDYYNAKK